MEQAFCAPYFYWYFLFLAKWAYVQEKPVQPDASQNSRQSNGAVNTLVPDWDIAGYKKVIDSLNKRKLFGKAGANLKELTDFTNAAGGSPFSKLKDSVTGEFLFYIQNNFGVNKLNKVIKGMQVSGDTSAFTNFIGQKLKGFYALNGKESFQIPSFQSIVNNDFNGASYKAARQDMDGAPTPGFNRFRYPINCN